MRVDGPDTAKQKPIYCVHKHHYTYTKTEAK